jgi:hypothetical protein
VAAFSFVRPPNRAKFRDLAARILKGLGITAGEPDILGCHNSKAFALELKSEIESS